MLHLGEAAIRDHAALLEAFVARAGDDPAARLHLAKEMRKAGQEARAMEIARALLTQAGPLDPAIAEGARSFLSRGVPNWHFSIVRDEMRNAAYQAALERAVTPETRVLDIGTGTGILAMMAARAGARHVYTCEMNPAVAAAAREIVVRNGYAERVTVIARHSGQLDAEADLGGRVDLLVSEIVSNNVLGERLLDAHEPAVRDLLKPGAPAIPARARARVSLARWPGGPPDRIGTVSGFDLSPFNLLARRHYKVDRRRAHAVQASAAVDLFDFDCAAAGPLAPERARVELAAEGGPVDGVLQWLALQMDDVGTYDAGPDAALPCAWAIRYHPFPAPVETVLGQRVSIGASHDRRSLAIWLDDAREE